MQLAIESCSLSVPSFPVPPPMLGGMIWKFTVLLPKSVKQQGWKGWGNFFFFHSRCVYTWIDSLRPQISSPWNSPGQTTGVGSLSLLQGIFPTQGLNPGLQHCRWILYQLSRKISPRILEWVAYPFSATNQTEVSCNAGRFFTNWATRESLLN